jgi:hypothetical protein
MKVCKERRHSLYILFSLVTKECLLSLQTSSSSFFTELQYPYFIFNEQRNQKDSSIHSSRDNKTYIIQKGTEKRE